MVIPHRPLRHELPHPHCPRRKPRSGKFILLGLLLPIVSVALFLLLIRRLEQRLGIRHMRQPPS
jgi:hypothetical protein